MWVASLSFWNERKSAASGRRDSSLPFQLDYFDNLSARIGLGFIVPRNPDR